MKILHFNWLALDVKGNENTSHQCITRFPDNRPIPLASVIRIKY